MPKAKQSRNNFFEPTSLPKKQTNKFNLMRPQVDLFSFVFWKKLKTSKRHFEIKWPLDQNYCCHFTMRDPVSKWKLWMLFCFRTGGFTESHCLIIRQYMAKREKGRLKQARKPSRIPARRGVKPYMSMKRLTSL